VPEWRGRAGAKRRTVAKARGCADRRAARGTECTECCIVCMTTECLFCTPCGIQPEWQARMARLRRSKAEELQERRRQEHSGGCGSGRAVKAGVRTRRRSCSALSSLFARGAPPTVPLRFAGQISSKVTTPTCQNDILAPVVETRRGPGPATVACTRGSSAYSVPAGVAACGWRAWRHEANKVGQTTALRAQYCGACALALTY
jgi:hypothetical protein